MPDIYKPIAQRLLEAETAITNTLSTPEILTAVSAYGYTETVLEAALALHAEVVELDQRQHQEYGEQYAATAAVQAAWDEAAVAYSNALKIARIVFRGDKGAQAALPGRFGADRHAQTKPERLAGTGQPLL